ncbi:hypothetical protein HJFPF1_11946 [Paramyrothecium foliicola]|nr:hypothetical protein HJFPF1_11946 [Paramyrothecium foliicola]
MDDSAQAPSGRGKLCDAADDAKRATATADEKAEGWGRFILRRLGLLGNTDNSNEDVLPRTTREVHEGQIADELMREYFNAIRTQLHLCATHLEKLQAAIWMLQAKTEKLETLVDRCHVILGKFDILAAMLQAAPPELQAMLIDLQAARDELQAENDGLGADCGELRAAIDEVQAQHDEARVVLDEVGAIYNNFCWQTSPMLQ